MKYELIQTKERQIIAADTIADAIDAALHLCKDGVPAVLTATPDRAWSPCAYVNIKDVAAAWERYNDAMCGGWSVDAYTWEAHVNRQDRELDEAISEATVWTWAKVDHKMVQDGGGWWTDYTLWAYGPERYYAVMGDRDIYDPEEDIFFEDREENIPYSDWDGETEAEAIEWFDCYPVYEDSGVLC